MKKCINLKEKKYCKGFTGPNTKYNIECQLNSVLEGTRHGDYGSFRFQMSRQKMPGGDCVSLQF